jgi:hypothetical protein
MGVVFHPVGFFTINETTIVLDAGPALSPTTAAPPALW